LNNNFA